MFNGRDENGRQQMSRCNTKFYSSFPGTVFLNSSSLSCKTSKDNKEKPQEVWKNYTGKCIRKKKHKADR